MAGYQYTIIIGNVGRDPELRYTQSGVAVCDFSVAVSRRWTDRNTNEPRCGSPGNSPGRWRSTRGRTSALSFRGRGGTPPGHARRSSLFFPTRSGTTRSAGLVHGTRTPGRSGASGLHP